MKKLVSDFLIKRGFKRLVKRIRNLDDKSLNSAETIDFLFSDEAELIRPWQFREELQQLADDMDALDPSVVVEIGTANGGTLFMSTRLSKEDALIVSIDLPGGRFGGGYPEWKIPIYKSFAKPGQDLHLVRGNSHEKETVEKLGSILNGKRIDYLFIDGDHTYEGVKEDFELYSPFVRDGGMIVFHDIVVHRNSSCDVYKYWNEVKEGKEYKEYVRDWDQNKFGIGTIRKVS